MHGTLRSAVDDDVPSWDTPGAFADKNKIPSDPKVAAYPIERSAYGTRRVNLPAAGLILAAHGLVLTFLVMLDVVPLSRTVSEPIVISLIDARAEPLPAVEQPPVPVETAQPRVNVPTSIIRVETPAPSPVVSLQVPAVQPPRPSAPMPSGPITVGDLDAKMVAITPPRYPLESRRRKEQGTVSLSVLLATDGSVAEIQLARSSGHERLDKAALEAVRKWRWSPTIRGGEPVMVRGTVDIPFILT